MFIITSRNVVIVEGYLCNLNIATGCEFYASDPNMDQPATFHTRFASYRVLLQPWTSRRSETIDLQTLLSKKFGVHNLENLIIGPFRYNAEFRDFFHSGIFHRLGSRLCQVKSEEDPALTMRDNCAPNSSASVFVWTTIVLLVLIRLLSLLIYFIWAPDGLADYPLKVRACLHDKTQVMTYRRKGDPFRLWKRLSQIANGCAYNQELIVKEFSSSSGLSLYHVSRRKRLYSDRRCKIVSINDALHMDAEEKLASFALLLSTGCKFYASDLNITEPSGFHTKFASYRVNIIYEHPDIVSAAQFVRSFRQILYRSSFLILRTSRSADDRYMNIFALNYVDRHCAVRHFAHPQGFLAKVLPDID
ncbi:unnamed protein product [Nippostrongylus brasiliensis]|uniref:Uncharacterized protein n=1 Tax=Nippostrongylus brasiliensis TaxID=27835 RepID=A0A0N4YRX7_NIPBR|nr:unnamed protein product [Nippostrongylus brasiliensis]